MVLKQADPSNEFNPIKTRRLFESVAEQLRETILKGLYNPGDRLPSEKELCKCFEVGRPVIREALRMLEMSGILFIRPGAGGGIFAKKVEPDHLLSSFETIIRLDRVTIKQIIEARLVIERAVLPLVFERIQPKDIEHLERSIAQAREALGKKIPEPKNLEFHVLLSEISGNPLLIMITRAIFDVTRKYLEQLKLSFERKKKVLDEHELILKNIKARKFDKVLEFMERHSKELHALKE